MEFVATIGIDNIINAILVMEDVRPAMLVQSADHGEAAHTDLKTASILQGIKQCFPELLHTNDYAINQGTIISKRDYNGYYISRQKMGQILGYPCYMDVSDDLNPENPYIIVVYADVIYENTNENENNKNKVSKKELFVNVSANDSKLQEFCDIAQQATTVFQTKTTIDKYNHILGPITVSGVYVKLIKNISSQNLVDKLLSNNTRQRHFYEDDKNAFSNILYNLNIENTDEIMEAIQWTGNPVHTGIMLQLLVQFQADGVQAFAPVQRFPKENARLKQISEDFARKTAQILCATRIN